MPRVLDAAQETARTEGAWTPYRFVRIVWPAPVGERYYSDRDFVADPGVTVEPILLSLPQVSREMELGLVGRGVAGTIQFTLRDDPDAAYPIVSIIERLVPVPQGARVDVYYAFKPVSGTLTTAQWSTLGIFAIDTAEATIGQARLTCIDYTEARGAKKIGRGITAANFPLAPDSSYNLIMPHIFGRCEACPAIPVTVGETAQLSGDIEPDTTVLFFDDLSRFPASGTVIMGGEKIAYTIRTATQMGSSSSPCQRGANATDAVEHADGTAARQKLDFYFWLVADHECHNLPDTSSVDINAGGKTVSATVSVQTIGGIDATFIVLAELPLKTEPSAIAISTDFSGAENGWSDAGSTSDSYVRTDGQLQIVSTSAEGAIDTTDQHVTFALLDPAAGKNVLSLDFSNDLSGRSAQLTNLSVAVTYRIAPNENLAPDATDFPWDSWGITISRLGSTVLFDLAKPDISEIRGLLDRTEFIPGIEDTTGKFLDTRGAMERKHQMRFRGNPRNVQALGGAGNNNAYFWESAAAGGTFFSMNAVDFVYLAGSFLVLTNWSSPSLLLQPDIPEGTKILGVQIAISIYAPITTKISFSAADPVPVEHFQGANVVAKLYNRWGVLLAESGAVLGNDSAAEIIIDWRAAEEIDAIDLSDGTLSIHSQAPGAGAADAVMEFLDVWVDAIDFRTWERTALLGTEEDINGELTSIDDILLASSSRVFTQELDLTAIVRDAEAYSDPWDFFAETINITLTATNPTASTRILVNDISFVAKERPIVSRSVAADALAVTLDVEGVASGGSLIETPEDVITHLIESPTWYGLSGYVNAASLTAALSEQAAANYKFARRIGHEIAARDALSSACLNSAIWFAMEAGEFYFDAMGSLSKVIPTRTLDRSQMPPGNLPVRSPVHTENTFNQMVVTFHRKFTGDLEPTRRVPELNSTQSQQFMGVLRKTLTLEWVRDTATANDVAARMLAQSAFPTKRITVTGTPEWLDVILSDKVFLTDADSGLIDEPARVYHAVFPDERHVQLSLETQGVREHFWVDPGDATTYIDVVPGSRIIFVISGVVIAYLTADAEWFLKGALEVALVGGTQTDIIERGGTSIFFAVDTDGTPPRSRMSELTSGGTLKVALPQTSISYPVLSPIGDYIEEADAGIAIAKLNFSVDKEWKSATLTLASLVAKRYLTNQQL